MSGYAASARLRGGAPRFVAADGPRPGEVPRTSATLTASVVPFDDGDWIELVGRPLGQRVAARWDSIRETWSQTTFYLFDPESWR